MTGGQACAGLLAGATAALVLVACSALPGDAAVPADPRTQASIQELMDALVDPAADRLWDAVATTNSVAGTEEHQPRTPQQWQAVRRDAIALLEASRLLTLEGRVVARGYVAAEGPGVSDSVAVQRKYDEERPLFKALARHLNEEAAGALAAIDARDPQALLAAGGRIDAACEACHATFWYPGQRLPGAPVAAPRPAAASPAIDARATAKPADAPAPSPSLEAALGLAQAALDSCLDHGFSVGVTVVDASGGVRAVLAQKGARAQAVDSSGAKAYTVTRYQTSTAELARRAAADPELAAQIAASPKLRARAGGLPLLDHGTLIGAIGVGGAPGGEKDEACAAAAVAAFAARLN